MKVEVVDRAVAQYAGEDSEAFKVLPDGTYAALADLGTLVVNANVIVRTVDGIRFSFAQVWK